MKDGLREGRFIEYAENGEIARKMGYSKGYFNDDCELYLQGKKIVEGKWIDGKPDGNWVLYDDQGKNKVAEVEMGKGKYKTEIKSTIKNENAKGCLSAMGFPLNKTTYPEIKLGTLEKGVIMGQLENLNSFTKGRMLQCSGADIGIEHIKNVVFIFDQKETLVAIRLVMPKDKPSKYGGGFGAGFQEVRNQFAKSYHLVSEQIPFVGNSYAKFSEGNCFILIDAPHLSSDMTVDFWVNGFGEAF